MANIFAEYAKPVRSIQDFQADEDSRTLRREQLAGVQRQNALAELMAGQQRQTMEDERRSNELIKMAYSGGSDGVVERLRATGNRAAIDLADRQETQALGRGKTTAETEKLRVEARAKATEDAETKRKALLQQVAALRSPEDALALIDHGVQSQSLPEPLAAGLRKMIGSDPRWQLNLMLGIGDPSKLVDVLRPHLQAVNSGKTTTFVDTNAYTNPAGPAPIQMTTTPGEDLTAKTSVENNQRTVGATLAGQRSVAETARLGRAQADRHFNARHDAEMPEKPLPAAVLKSVTEARDNAATIDRLASSFKPNFAGKGVFGLGAEMQMGVSGNLGADRDAVEWWKNYRKQAELVERHALFGAALTPTEQASWRSADISPGMDAKVVKKNLATRKELSAKVAEATKQDMIDAGHSEGRITKIAGRGEAKPAAIPAGPAKITDDAGYNALPSGATFIGPDGKTRRKP